MSRLPRTVGGAFARRPWAGALLLYGSVALVFFGLPVLDHPTRDIVGTNDIEPSVFMWFLGWWPHAIGSGSNPLVSDLIFAPDGYNLAWVTPIPVPSLLLAPITLVAGPVVAYNAFALLAPTLAAWTAFLLCRHLTAATGASLVGGYLFGFSPYMLANLQGVPNLATVALLPLCVLLIVRHVEGSLSSPRFVVAGTTALVAQFLTSNELVATLTVFGALTWLCAFAWLRERRAALWRTAKLTALAYGLSVLVLSPYLYYMFFEPAVKPAHAVPGDYSADLLSFLFPTGIQRLGRTAFENLALTFGGEGGGPGGGGRAYLGLPLLAIVAHFAVERWRTRTARVVLAAFAITAVAALGPHLRVAGIATIPMPWRPFTELPLLRYAIPASFTIFMFLAAAVIVTAWLGRSPSRGRWLLVGCALIFLAPNLGSSRWQATAGSPPFFDRGDYRDHLSERDRVFVVPPIGGGQRWQAESGMAFELTGGYIGRLPDDYARFYDRVAALAQAPGPAATAEVRRFMTAKGVTAIVVDAGQPGRWPELLAGLGVAPTRTGGVLLYRLRPPRSP